MTHRPLAPLAGVVLGLGLLLAGCGSDSSSDESTSSPSRSSTASASSSEACDTMATLTDDVQAMATADNLQQFQSAYDSAKQDFADLEPAVKSSYGDDVDAVGTSLKQFGTALKNFGDNGVMKGLENLGTAAGKVSDSVDQLATDLDCPSSSG